MNEVSISTKDTHHPIPVPKLLINSASVWLFQGSMPHFSWEHDKLHGVEMKLLEGGRCCANHVRWVLIDSTKEGNFRGLQDGLHVSLGLSGLDQGLLAAASQGNTRTEENFCLEGCPWNRLLLRWWHFCYSTQKEAIWPQSGIWGGDCCIRSLSQWDLLFQVPTLIFQSVHKFLF